MNVRDLGQVLETLRVLREGRRLEQARLEFVLEHGPNTVRAPVQCRLARLRLPADDSSASTVKGFRPHEFYRETLWVPMLRGDQALRDVLHHGQRPAIVKVDVEGGELEVLEGMEQILGQDRPFVLCEVLPIRA